MRIAWNNLADDATLTPSQESPLYPAENVQDAHAQRVWKGLDATENLVIDLGSAQAVTCVGIAGHNFTATVTVTLQGNATNSWGAPSFSEVLTIYPTALHFFTSATYRYWRLVVADTGVVVTIGRIFLGTFYQMPGMGPAIRLPKTTTSLQSVSPMGAVFGDAGRLYRAATINFPNVTNAHRSGIDEIFESVDRITPVFIAVWENQLSFEPPLYALIDQANLDWQKQHDTIFSLGLTITEVE